MAKITIGMDPSKVAQAERRTLAEQQEALEWTAARTEALYDALNHIAEACDNARGEDGVGFSRDDVEDGHYYANTDWRTWDSNDITTVNTLVRKYRMTQVPRRLACLIWPIEFPNMPGDEKLVREADGPEGPQWGELFGRPRVKEDR